MINKASYIEFMVKSNVLVFGDLIAKSGRETPYMINTGNFNTSKQLAVLGEFYADSIQANINKLDVLFGPAYKGISLSVTTAVALSHKYNRDVAVSFNRKEKKDHGEGGQLIGYVPNDDDNITIVEDVITAGTSVRESIALLNGIANVNITNLVVSVDRLERGQGNKSTLEELNDEFGITTTALVTIDDIITYLHNREIDGKIYIDNARKQKLEDHLNMFGVK